MAQWQEVQNLANTHLEQVHQLYAGSALPMAVRQCLAAWIESQNWRQAAEPLSSHAPMLFHSLLVLLGERLGSLGSGYEDFMLKHNLRKAHRDLQAEFGKKPEQFANLVANLLQEERRILRLGQAAGQAGSAPAPSPAPESGREQQIQRRLAEFQTALQEADRAFRHLEELQDAFDFCYKVHYLPGHERSRDPEYIQELQALQAKLQKLDRRRREVLAQMQQLLGRSETLQELLQQELGDWRVRQQRLCLGGPGDANLRPLETWFTELGQGLFQLRQLLRALGDLRQKVTYERDPLAAETPLLEQRLQEQLTHLLRSAFVVEQQPSTPNARQRPLVLRTGSKFSARARLLLRLHDRNHRMEAKIHIDRDPPNVKGFRRFNILTSSSKTLLAGDSPQEGLICDFQYLTLKEQKDSRAGKGKGGGGEGPLVVTEELHLITFTLAYAYCGLELELETTTLPFVIISNNNQLSSAWASILWFNMLSSDPKAQQFFSSPPPAPWPRLAEVLSWQFQSVAERGLSRENLLMLAKKLLGSKPSPDSTVAWPKFSKDGAAGFSFWTWLDAILGLLQEHLKQLWKDGLILGFVSRKQEEKLLKSKRTGTFLLRFSESVLGGVTFTWVEHHETGPPSFRAVEPYRASELVSLALPDIIRNYQMMMEENPPENPLKFLYPGTARDEAFGRYYSQKQEENLGESKKYLNRRLIRVSSRQPAWKTEEELVFATENLETLQLQPGGHGAQRAGGLALPQGLGTPQGTPGNVGTPQGTPGNVGTPQGVAVSPGTPQGMATSPGTLQVTPGNLGTPQMMATSPGTLQVTPGNLGTPQMMATSPGTPQMVAASTETLQVTPGNLGTSQVMAMTPGTLQVVATSPGIPQVTPGNLGTSQMMVTSPGTLQVTPGNLGTPQMMVTSPGTLQVTPGNLGTSHVMVTSPGTLQVTPGNLGTPQMMATSPGTPQMVAASTGTLQVTPGNLGTSQVMAMTPGTLQVTPGNLGTPQVMATTPGTPQPRGLGTLQAQPQGLEPPRVGSGVPDVQGTLQAAPGAVVPEEGTLPPELRDLELLPGGQDMLELLQSLEGLEPASGGPGGPGRGGAGAQRGGNVGGEIPAEPRQRRAPGPPRPVPAAARGLGAALRSLPLLLRRLPPALPRRQRLPVTPSPCKWPPPAAPGAAASCPPDLYWQRHKYPR
ncbi:signal transducer and activator of transcription 2 isoform X2 [Hirundo rustica]|uniref:signal transducer and activator of transcription 2 isoform X2 n=1 Tax=Hirundo rustica TaxID=43150 RepID=UPI0026726B76|nr:signal transducer and activator of transcription 2 isoform X2 [Hirundo rustica]